MNWTTRLALFTLLSLLAASVAAQSGSGSTVTCLTSQYLDTDTNECMNYENQGVKASTDYDTAIDSGNTAWMLASSALVMIMTPGVAFFYAGLAGEDMASNTMMMSFVSMAMVSIQFWAFGYSAAFSSHGIFGWAGYNNVREVPSGTYGTGIPHILGFGALAAALVVGKRYNHGEPVKPHNVPLVMIGATLLWFGWFGFNAGSSGAADGIAATAAINTHLAASAGFLTWWCRSWLGFDHPSLWLRVPLASVIFGVVGAITGFGAVHMKNHLRYDDTLDSFGIHGCAGVMGGLMTGLFATSEVNPNIEGGAFYGHGMLFVHQLVSQCVAAAYSFVVTMIILYVLKLTIGLRVDEDKEVNGIDVSYHGGLAYDYSAQDHNGPTVKAANPPSTDFASMMTPSMTQESVQKEPIMNV
ncbi:Radial spoke head protein 9 [Phytophthora nicotianae]|uniref:Radial spoke head protein 9 n=1 Tax=Phytophthora nicotianae TaxID=4792 RepID=A0A0W8DIM7_PHYNI|nr:Radial spoke head protein 9 [Phytophthora nicotianae]